MEDDDPQDWPPLTAFYHYAWPSSQSTTTTNASPPPIAVTTTYTDGTTATTNHTAPVTILIFHNPIHPSFDHHDADDDDNKNGNENNNSSDPPSLDPPSRRCCCAGCRQDFASTVVADDIATFPVLAGPHCACAYHAGCLAQPYFDRATVLPVRRRNMACPACGGEGFGGREAEMGCWEDDDDDEWEKGVSGGDGEDEGDDDDDIVQFEMPRSAVVTEGMVVIRLESEWEEGAEVEAAAEGAVARRAVSFALIVKWASGDDGEGGKEVEEGKQQAQQDGNVPGNPVLPGCEQRLASLALDQPQQQQKIQEKTVASAEDKEDVGPAA